MTNANSIDDLEKDPVIRRAVAVGYEYGVELASIQSAEYQGFEVVFGFGAGLSYSEHMTFSRKWWEW